MRKLAEVLETLVRVAPIGQKITLARGEFFKVRFFDGDDGYVVASVEVRPKIDFSKKTVTFVARASYPSCITDMSHDEVVKVNATMVAATGLLYAVDRLIGGEVWSLDEYLPLENGVQ